MASLPQVERLIFASRQLFLQSHGCSSFLLFATVHATPICRRSVPYSRNFTSSPRHYARQDQNQNGRGSFRSRLRTAWGSTRVQWYPIPVGLGIGFLGFAQLFRVRQREKTRQVEEKQQGLVAGESGGVDEDGKPKRRKRVRPSGPW